jgi:hypothetical protein
VVRTTRFSAVGFRQSVQAPAQSRRRRERVKECLLLQLSDFSSPEPLTLDVASLAGVPESVRSGAVAGKVGQVLPLFASSAKLHRRASSILPLCQRQEILNLNEQPLQPPHAARPGKIPDAPRVARRTGLQQRLFLLGKSGATVPVQIFVEELR